MHEWHAGALLLIRVLTGCHLRSCWGGVSCVGSLVSSFPATSALFSWICSELFKSIEVYETDLGIN